MDLLVSSCYTWVGEDDWEKITKYFFIYLKTLKKKMGEIDNRHGNCQMEYEDLMTEDGKNIYIGVLLGVTHIGEESILGIGSIIIESTPSKPTRIGLMLPSMSPFSHPMILFWCALFIHFSSYHFFHIHLLLFGFSHFSSPPLTNALSFCNISNIMSMVHIFKFWNKK